MSKSHKVKTGDTLGALAVRYLGLWSKWTQIKNANPQLMSRRKASDGSPVIYPGDVLIIPSDETLPAKVTNATPQVLDNSAAQDISIYIEGELFTGFTGYTLSLVADSLDAFSFSAPFDDSVASFQEAFRPFLYRNCAVYYARKLVFAGRLLTPDPEVASGGQTINLQGYPLCGVLQDACLPVTKYPPQYAGLKLSEIASDAASPFGVTVSLGSDEGNAFDKVGYEPGDKILDFLVKLAQQRGLICTNTSDGMLYFHKPSDASAEVSFVQGKQPMLSCRPMFNAQDFYSHITGFTKTTKNAASSSYTYQNEYLVKAGVLRPYAYTVEDTDSVDLEKAVKQKACSMFASAVSYELKVTGHTYSDGTLYHKGMFVSVKAPGAMIYRETKLYADKVELSRSDSDGDTTTFSLVLPGCRTGSIPEAFPWES